MRQSCRLYLSKTWDWTDEDTGRPERSVGFAEVDWRQALHDALLGVDVNPSRVAAEFEQLVQDPAYEADA